MKKGYLSEYFTGIATKRLSAVEADTSRSNQHEFNGVEGLMRLFGRSDGKQSFPSRFVYLSDADENPIIVDGSVTWYDARERHPTRSEHRLYFPTTAVSERAAAGDLLVIARRADGSILVLVTQNGSTITNQVEWLFGVHGTAAGFDIREDLESERDRIAFASRLILESIGIPVEAPAVQDYLEDILRRFSGVFPSTRDFSAYARSTLPAVNPAGDPDAALMVWMEREEALFRCLEAYLISERLKNGFENDVDGFISYSLSVQNRRKSRVGRALENHLEYLFSTTDIRYSRTAITENLSKPDFLFPGAAEYHNAEFSAQRLTMLGVKSTCKDRWRQVLAEADRIPDKHLLTLESAISIGQTNEMQAKRLQLVVPTQLHASYSATQQSWLMDVATFSQLVQSRQRIAGGYD